MTTQTDDDARFASTLIDGARMYATAADAVNDKLPNALHVLSHLLGMSAELALKSYLKHNNVPTSELRKLGHDLGAIYKRAQDFGLLYTGSRNFCLNVLGSNYRERIFAYPEEAQLVVITPRSLREIVHELILNVFEVVKGKETLEELDEQMGLTIIPKTLTLHHGQFSNAQQCAQVRPRGRCVPLGTLARMLSVIK